MSCLNFNIIISGLPEPTEANNDAFVDSDRISLKMAILKPLLLIWPFINYEEMTKLPLGKFDGDSTYQPSLLREKLLEAAELGVIEVKKFCGGSSQIYLEVKKKNPKVKNIGHPFYFADLLVDYQEELNLDDVCLPRILAANLSNAEMSVAAAVCLIYRDTQKPVKNEFHELELITGYKQGVKNILLKLLEYCVLRREEGGYVPNKTKVRLTGSKSTVPIPRQEEVYNGQLVDLVEYVAPMPPQNPTAIKNSVALRLAVTLWIEREEGPKEIDSESLAKEFCLQVRNVEKFICKLFKDGFLLKEGKLAKQGHGLFSFYCSKESGLTAIEVHGIRIQNNKTHDLAELIEKRYQGKC
jgi:hypothetical protein